MKADPNSASSIARWKRKPSANGGFHKKFQNRTGKKEIRKARNRRDVFNNVARLVKNAVTIWEIKNGLTLEPYHQFYYTNE